jgi:hypothetical protein
MKHFPILVLGFLLLISCSDKSERKNQVKKIESNSTSNEIDNEINITAKFNWFELLNDKPYSLEFEKESGEAIYFEDCSINNFDFVVKLKEAETSEFNKGWGTDLKLQGKWFNITYIKNKQPKKLNDSISLYVIKKVTLDTTVREIEDINTKEVFSVRAKFIKFWLGDTEHYSFEKESGEIISFNGSEVENFDFGIELDASKTNDLNQGWGSNSKLQGKWFKLTYFYKEQQLYIDGPMGTVRIINKAILD